MSTHIEKFWRNCVLCCIIYRVWWAYISSGVVGRRKKTNTTVNEAHQSGLKRFPAAVQRSHSLPHGPWRQAGGQRLIYRIKCRTIALGRERERERHISWSQKSPGPHTSSIHSLPLSLTFVSLEDSPDKSLLFILSLYTHSSFISHTYSRRSTHTHTHTVLLQRNCVSSTKE